jgi:hypothetical protein
MTILEVCSIFPYINISICVNYGELIWFPLELMGNNRTITLLVA